MAVVGSITEFGAVTTEVRTVLEALSLRHRSPLPAAEKTFVAMLGSSDLIEIALFDHDFHLADASGSGTHAFRRSHGVYLPPDQALAEVRRATQPEWAESWATLTLPDPTRPLLALLYAKLSPIAALCVPEGAAVDTPLAEDLLRRAMGGTGGRRPLFDFCRTLVGVQHDSDPGLGSLRVAPAIGLDAVELVLLVRSARLEDLGALSFALRHLRIGDVWPLPEARAAADRAARLLGRPGGAAFGGAWQNACVFRTASTRLGVPVRPHDMSWHLEEGPEENVMTLGTVSVRATFEAGCVQSALDVGSHVSSLFSVTASPEAAKPAERTDLTEFLMLLGQRDTVAFASAKDHRELHPLSYASLKLALEYLAGLGNERPPSGLTVATEIALRFAVPSDACPDPTAAADLDQALRTQLRTFRKDMLGKEGTASWTARWLAGTKRAGIVYPVTGGGVNVISAALDHVDEDIEGFVEVLEAIDMLVQAAGDPAHQRPDFARELASIADCVETLVESRSRRQSPLELPGHTYSFEGHAGYRVFRDAFLALLDDVRQVLHYGGHLVVLDESGGGLTCEHIAAGVAQIRVSGMTLRHPVHYVHPHEVAHARFHELRFRDLDEECQDRALRYLNVATSSQQLDTPDHLDWTIYQIHDRAGAGLRGVTGDDTINRAVGMVLREVAEDVLLYLCLRREGEEAAASRQRFAFVRGFGLVHAYGVELGALDRLLDPVLHVAIILRWALVDCLIATYRGESRPWRRVLLELVAELGPCAVPSKVPVPRPADADPTRTAVQVQQLFADLGLSQMDLKAALRRVNLLGITADAQHRQLGSALDAWLHFSVSLVRLPTVQPSAIASARGPRAIYADYVDRLREARGGASPWLPVVDREDSLASTAAAVGVRRGGVLARDQSGYLADSLRFALRLDDYTRHRRYCRLVDLLNGLHS